MIAPGSLAPSAKHPVPPDHGKDGHEYDEYEEVGFP
jgi:hypothetical protein